MCTIAGEEAWGRQPPGLGFGSDRTPVTCGEEGRREERRPAQAKESDCGAQ
jgi:hypothetical protein